MINNDIKKKKKIIKKDREREKKKQTEKTWVKQMLINLELRLSFQKGVQLVVCKLMSELG